MPNPLIISLAILPGILLAWWMMRQDKYEQENRWFLLLAFGIGMLITVPAMWLETWLAELGFDDPEHFGKILFFAFIGVALVEEALKAIGILVFPFFQPFFNEPIDGIVYTVMVGLGFATLENVLYADRFGLETVILRAFTAVPAHAAFSVIMGFFIGKAKMEDSGKRWILFAQGIGLAVLVHGFYDFFILQSLYSWLIIFAIVVLFASAYLARRMILMHQEISPFRQPIKDSGLNP